MPKQRTACFSGHRPGRFPYARFSTEQSDFQKFKDKVTANLIQAVEAGYEIFVCGLASGFDLVAGEALIDLKASGKQYGHIQLLAALPHPSHGFGKPWNILHELVRKNAKTEVVIAQTASKRSYLARNKFMVNQSSLLICYYDGKEGGGTGYTVRYAEEKGLTIVNLA
jgi:uncharacterized phage-like protein YoqJ